MKADEFVPRDGAMRFKDGTGEYVYANPGDPMYSTVIMMAEEIYDTDRQEWVSLIGY